MDTLKPLNVLISLYRGYGMGDAVQMSAVLQHVKKYRPHWIVDFQAEEGRECVGNGIVANTFCYGQPHPSSFYDVEVQILLYDTWANWQDRPNTRVSSCLHERFGLDWDAECGSYKIEVNLVKESVAYTLLSHITRDPKRPRVAFHYWGDSSPTKKNLSHDQAIKVCRDIELWGGTPILLDWRNTSPIPETYCIPTVGGFPFSKEWGRDASMNCAVISQCDAFIGIDSGPGKCASATDTPSLIIWTGHHPAPFHDPAPNTTHLVPEGYHGLEPVCNDAGVIKWFEAHHNILTYDRDPIPVVRQWLEGVLP